MRTFIKTGAVLLGCFGLAACSTSQFAYGHHDAYFTALAAASTPHKSDVKAYQKAVAICDNDNRIPKIKMIRRVPNSVKSIEIDGKSVAIPKWYQTQDYMTAIVASCVYPKPVK